MLGGLTPRKANEVIRSEKQGAFIFLYAPGGAGKTLLAASLREFGKTGLFDAEGGSAVLEDIEDENLHIFDIQKYSELRKASAELKKDAHGYANIIVDNLSEIVDLYMADNFGVKQYEIQEWGEMTTEILRLVRELRNIARLQGVNIIIIMWDEHDKDEKGRVKQMLLATPKLQAKLPGICTTVVHIDTVGSPEWRRLNFGSSEKSVNKFRRSGNAAAQAIPFEIWYQYNNLPLVDVIKTMKGEQNWPSSKYKKPSNSNS